jgi:uncharacterized NAD-dependent epimerase/dehydratase family protein
MRRYAILTPRSFTNNAKTAHGVIRYSPDVVVAVIDPDLGGRRVRDVLPHLNSDAPIVNSVHDALQYAPTSLLIGTAPAGGHLPPEWRAEILDAIAAKLEIVNGLHDFMSEDAEFAAAAAQSGSAIVDVRKPPQVPLFSGAVYDVAAPILLTVGNDCAVGKMTASLEIVEAARNANAKAVFVPTGQTGIMIAGWGIAIDRVIADFAAGAAEQLVLEAARSQPDVIVVEGQGAINHPAFAAVTTALIFGAAPDALLLVCNPQLTFIEDYTTPILSYTELVRMYESLAGTVKPARVLGIALNTGGMSDAAARQEIEKAANETGLPADDVVRFGARKLYDAIAPGLVKRQPLRVAPVYDYSQASSAKPAT